MISGVDVGSGGHCHACQTALSVESTCRSDVVVPQLRQIVRINEVALINGDINADW